MVGVSFLGKTVVYAQQINDDSEPVIEMVGETLLSEQWSITNINQPQFREEMEILFETIKNDLHFPDRQIRVVLPYEWVHFYTLFIDEVLNPDEQREYLRWEFQQRLGEQPQGLHPQFYPLTPSNGYRQVVTIGIPENVISVLRNATDRVHLHVSAIELSPFSALTNIPDLNSTGCVCKFSESTAEMTAFEHQTFIASALFTFDENHVLRLIRSSGSESETKELQAVLSSIFAQESTGVSTFIYGKAIPESVQSLTESGKNIAYVRPFQDIRVHFRQSGSANVMDEAQYTEVAGTIRQALGDPA